MTENSPPDYSLSEGLEADMQSYQAGDADGAARLVDRLSPPIFHFFLAQVRDRARAEDLLQEFWLRIHKARHTYRLGEPFLPWAFSIARRVRVDEYRRRSRVARHEVQSEILPEMAGVSRESTATASLEVNALLNELPDGQRETVFLLKVMGLTLEEVARATGTTVGAVKQKSHRAFGTLRKLLGRTETPDQNASEKLL